MMKKQYFKLISLIILFNGFHLLSYAQYKAAEVSISGLTCSQCSRSVEMKLRRLNFVKDVKMDLEHTQGHISFKEDQQVDINKIAAAVSDAGFSVKSLQAVYHFSNMPVTPEKCVNFSGDTYAFVKISPQTLNGDITVKFIGESYLPKKDLKQWKPYLKNSCNNGKVYYITM